MTVHSTDPWTIEQAIEYEGESLYLNLDAEMQTTVVECSLDGFRP